MTHPESILETKLQLWIGLGGQVISHLVVDHMLLAGAWCPPINLTMMCAWYVWKSFMCDHVIVKGQRIQEELYILRGERIVVWGGRVWGKMYSILSFTLWSGVIWYSTMTIRPINCIQQCLVVRSQARMDTNCVQTSLDLEPLKA